MLGSRWADPWRWEGPEQVSTSTEPVRSLQVSVLALRSWTARQRLAAVGFSIFFALLVGIPTVLIPNPVFGRQVPVHEWNYPVWMASSVLPGCWLREDY